MTEPPAPEPPLVEVGRYGRLSQARERALVVSAMELPHWIVRDGRSFTLRVEAAAQAAVAEELARFEAEQSLRAAQTVPEKPLPKIETLSLYVAAWFLSACWLAQNLTSEAWQSHGEAMSRVIVRDGEWWRAFTALTLHGDIVHLVANLASGLLFAAFVLPHLGSGITWLAIVASGAIGNLMNAWFYRGVPHNSIGSSTAVFGALGLLVACEFAARLFLPRDPQPLAARAPARRRPRAARFSRCWRSAKADRSHGAFWGFLAGLAIGALGAILHTGARLGRFWQRVAAALGPLLLVLAWWLALRRSS